MNILVSVKKKTNGKLDVSGSGLGGANVHTKNKHWGANVPVQNKRGGGGGVSSLST